MKEMKITQYVNLDELFEEDAFFIIPDYQRGYAWGTNQIADLIEDIKIIKKKDDENLFHFTGTIVAIKDNEQRWEVIDGQQRLTTLIILIKAIYDKNQDDSLLSKYIQSGKIGNEKLKLSPNAEAKSFFNNFIIKNETNTTKEYLSHENISNAKVTFDNWLKKCKDKDVDRILKVITTKLKFIFFTPENNNEAGLMFEIINNRGKSLSELEKIKNYFVYLSIIHELHTLRENINSSWGTILKNLNKANVRTTDDENSFLRFCYIVFFNANTKKSWHVYRELKAKDFSIKQDWTEEKTKKLQDFLIFLENGSKQYSYFYNGKHFITEEDKNDELALQLKYLRCHPVHASIMPLYLAITHKENNSEKKLELLKLLEVLNFRVYVLPKVTSRADSHQGTLFSWANQYFADINKFEGIANEQYSLLNDALSSFINKHCSTTKFVEHLTIDKDEYEDYYHWRGLKYFLARYEEKLQSEDKTTWDIEQILKTRDACQSNDYISLEHIWALKNRKDDYPIDYIEKRRLGNFIIMPLGKNIKLKHIDIPAKITKIIEMNTNFVQVGKLKKYLKVKTSYERKVGGHFEELSKRINDKRETDLIRFALETWKINQDKKINVKVDSLKTDSDKNYIIEDIENN